MANKNINGITIEINGDVTKLDRALSQVDKDLAATQRNLKEVDRLLKLDPKNVELIDQKQRLLSKAVDETSKRYETLKKTLEESTASNAQAEKWAEAQRSFQSELTKTENALHNLEAEQRNLQTLGYAPDSSQMQDVQRELDKTRDHSEELRAKMAETYEQLGRPISVDQYDALQRELADTKIQMENAKQASADFEAGVDTLGGTEEDAAGKTGKFSELLGAAGISTSALTAAGAVALAAKAIKEFAEWSAQAVKESAEYADEIDTLSTNFGISIDKLQEYAYMTELIDTPVETITGSITKLTQAMGKAQKGNEEVSEAFAKLNVNIYNADGTLRDASDVFEEAVGSLNMIHDSTERDLVAMQLFGRRAQGLNSIVQAMADGSFKELQREAHEVGYVLSQDDLDALNEVKDGFDRMDKQMEIVKRQIAVELAPELIELTKQLLNVARETDWKMIGQAIAHIIRDVTPFVVVLAQALAGLAMALAALINAAHGTLQSVAGSKFGGQLGAARSGRINGFASGGVIEPNSPMLALVGDNTHEREVIAPRSELVSAAMEAISRSGGAGGGKIVCQVVFGGTDQQIVRALAPQLDAHWQDVGATM